ncbi:hypothetical protein COCCADRAFT_28194 [Bipolaris zeicola 26-R-13]|uniref:Uncharacterized protein n=1 Tax=Cochliobolus carbonum (strain 26-R-13) TaxID=930089 RepID=W6XZ50_COCC2|nr:uncharacterized protein COCCADRAFT_28194 [Bipolaris zeicola 26-R-13]EUC31013.1 hypothetical protein COCCADRAFT_28194 [Bipolaris zeicola 26-R-13]
MAGAGAGAGSRQPTTGGGALNTMPRHHHYHHHYNHHVLEYRMSLTCPAHYSVMSSIIARQSIGLGRAMAQASSTLLATLAQTLGNPTWWNRTTSLRHAPRPGLAVSPSVPKPTSSPATQQMARRRHGPASSGPISLQVPGQACAN